MPGSATAKVIEEAQKLGIRAESFKDQVLFEPDELLSKGGTHYNGLLAL